MPIKLRWVAATRVSADRSDLAAWPNAWLWHWSNACLVAAATGRSRLLDWAARRLGPEPPDDFRTVPDCAGWILLNLLLDVRPSARVIARIARRAYLLRREQPIAELRVWQELDAEGYRRFIRARHPYWASFFGCGGVPRI